MTSRKLPSAVLTLSLCAWLVPQPVFAAPVVLASEPASEDWDAELDLDESDRDAWPAVLAELSAAGHVVLGATDSVSPAHAEKLWNAVQLAYPGAAEDCRGFYYVRFKAGSNVAEEKQKLDQLTGVEGVLPVHRVAPAGDLPPNTAPSLGASQGYFFTPNLSFLPLGAGSLGGHDLLTLRRFGSNGSSVRTAILEFGAHLPPWGTLHEDLQSANVTVLFPFAGNDYVTGRTLAEIDHGAATLGIHCADQDDPNNPQLGPGITGATPNAQVFLVPFQSLENAQHLAAAILAATTVLQPRDVLNMSLHTMNGGFPVSLSAATRSAVQSATALGIYVTEAAGNGAQNLDLAGIPNDGALWIGALNPANGARASFSNFGSQVTVCSWGLNVATHGYGDASVPAAQSHERYTLVYSGTSSASAIVSALLATANDAWNTTFTAFLPAPVSAPSGALPGAPLEPAVLYSALRHYEPIGYPGFQNIGQFPDAQSLSRRIAVVPYGLGSSTNCTFPLCALNPPTLSNTWIETCAAPPVRVWGEPAIGGAAFALRFGNIPPFSGSFNFYAISLLTGITTAPGFPGPIYIDLPTLLPLPGPQLTGSVCGGIGAPALAGQAYYSFVIPSTIPDGFSVNVTAASVDPSGGIDVANGLRLILQL